MNAPEREFGVVSTRVFKSGNSQAVRIPAELAYDSNDMEVTITRSGDVITISPKRQGVKEMLQALRALPAETKFGPIERTQLRRTTWDK